MKKQITHCPRCGSSDLKSITGCDEPTMHYGRIICSDCGRFIDWIPKPKNQKPEVSDLTRTRYEFIDKILNSAFISGRPETRLSQQEIDFLHSPSVLNRLDRLTEPQLRWLDSISKRLLGEPFPTIYAANPYTPSQKTTVLTLF